LIIQAAADWALTDKWKSDVEITSPAGGVEIFGRDQWLARPGRAQNEKGW